MGHMDNRTHRQWGTGMGIWAMGYMGMGNGVQGYGAQSAMGHRGNGVQGYRAHGQWGTVGNGVHGQWGPWVIGTFLPIGPLILRGS